MPMLGKEPFVREKPPKDLRPDEKLFYCKTTHEVFRQYEEFFDRVILCNSLVWTCSISGKNNLTYSEAIESEENARRTLKNFPEKLKKPLLFLATLTHRSRLNDMCDDVFNFVKDRYFIGERVDVSLNGIKKPCEIKKVISTEKEPKTPKSDSKKKTPSKQLSPDKVKYEIEEKEQGRRIIVKSQCVSRPKGVYTKPQNKLFLKHHSESMNGVWKVKDNAVRKYDLENFQMRSVFPGPLPKYAAPSSPKKKTPTSPVNVEKSVDKKKSNAESSAGKKTVQGKLNFKKDSEEEKRKTLEREQEEFVKHRLQLEEERQRRKEEMRKRIEDEKERLREQKLKEREQKKEEKRKMAEYMISWKKPRDDLECDDLKDLPKPTPVECNIPQECFGDAVMLLEFLNTFKDIINLKDSFPHGFAFEHLEKALLETDIQGYLNDLIQLLLSSIFQLQDFEDEKVNVSFTKGDISAFKDHTSSTVDEAVAIATASTAWPQLYHGTILRNMPLDSFSITEVLRLHILASGSDKNHAPQFGLSGLSEDPGLYFKIEEADLVKKLATTSVFELTCEERIKILSLLTHQLASCSTVRNLVDENLTKAKPLRYELKSLRWAYARQQKEITLSNVKKKPDDKNPSEEAKGVENAVGTAEEEEKENIDNLTPEELAALEEKKQRKEAKLRQEFQRKEYDLLSKIQELQSSYQVVPIGRDRAYRRFWIFQSLPGIFVEHDDKDIGKCLPKVTPQISTAAVAINRTENTVNNIRKYLQQIESPKNGSSDKENDILQDLAIIQSDMSMPLKDRKLSDLNPRVDFKKSADDEHNCLLCKDKMSELQSTFPHFCPHEKNSSVVFGLCTACIETCPVHNVNAPRTKWSFFYKEEELETLLSSLNQRGFREGPLREAITLEKESILKSMAKCQYHTLNRSLPPPLLPEVRKSQRKQRKSDFAHMKPHEALEITLRDMILELEHRIYAGGLGSIKVPDRNLWRSTIDQSISYDQSEDEHLDSKSEPVVNGIKEEKRTEEQIIKELANALLQISQGIEAKFLHPPLGESDNFKQLKEKALKNIAAWEAKQKTKESESETVPEPCPSVPESALTRWQESLKECSSLSQLFVHLGTLERSVAWSRSVLKAHCRICRRRGDAENMLLCDGCNRGHHLYCLKPPLEEIPLDDWFCLSCKPPEKTTPQKKRYVDGEDSESENESEESEEEEDDDDEDYTSDENSESEVAVIEVCESCGAGGTVICCDGCPDVYHPECIGLRRIPRGEWLCPKCKKKKDACPVSGSYETRAYSLFNDSQESKKSPKLRTKIQIKAGLKRQREDSSDSDYITPKRSKTEKKKDVNDSSEKQNPFKKIYKDTALNTARRRSKSNLSDEDQMLDYKTCFDLLVELMRHPSSWPFLAPVSKKDAPGYHLIVKRPMDFGTIRSKLNNMSYKNNEEFVQDLYLVLQNCEFFNPRYSEEYKAARELHKEVKRLLQEFNLSSSLCSRIERNLISEICM